MSLTIESVQQLRDEETSQRFGKEIVYLVPNAGVILCRECAIFHLENTPGSTLDSQLEDGDQRYYGGATCDACGAEIVTALCPVCADPLSSAPTLRADNQDASRIHTHCAAALVCEGVAERIPGRGVSIQRQSGLWYVHGFALYQYR